MQRRTFLNLGLVSLGTSFAMASPAAAFQYIPASSEEKWAILFGTWYGTSRDASIWISEGLGGIASVYDIRQKPDLSSYDRLVIGTSIQGGKGPKELETYIQNNISELQSKIKGVFVICGNGGQKPGQQQKERYIDNYLAPLCKAQTVPGQVFGGRITKRLLSEQHSGFFATTEDYDNLSRTECLAFGKEILDQNA